MTTILHADLRTSDVFKRASLRIISEAAAGEISPYQRDWFLRIVEHIEVIYPDPDQAVVALRDKAISLRAEGEICSGGLNRFLRACGLRPWSRLQAEGNSPWASDYPDDEA